MRLVDAEEVKAKMESTFDMQDLYLPCHFQNILDETPTVDAVEVVRCKDCKFFWKNSVMTKVQPCLAVPRDDDFCSWGEREEDETD